MIQQEKVQLLKKAFGRYWNTGEEYLFICPKCGHHKPKMSINISRNAFKCWVCDYSGKNVSSLFKAYAPAYYGQWCSISNVVDISKYDNLFQQEENIPDHPALELPKNFKTLTGYSGPLKLKPLKYLQSRGLTRVDICKWKIGYCDYGEFQNRVIVPSFDCTGRLNYFIARSYDNNPYRYKNPKSSKDIIFNDLNIDWCSDITIVEGVFDAIKAENAIPLLGPSLREGSRLFEKICAHRPTVYLALDSDASKKQFLMAKKLKEYGINVKIIDISPYADVGEMPKGDLEKRKLKAGFVSEMDYLKYELNL